MSAYSQVHPDGRRRARYGWDRPLQYYFLTVSDPEEDEILYSNLDDAEATYGPRSGGLSLEQLRSRLETYGFALDEAAAETLTRDASGRSQQSPAMLALLQALNAGEGERQP